MTTNGACAVAPRRVCPCSHASRSARSRLGAERRWEPGGSARRELSRRRTSAPDLDTHARSCNSYCHEDRRKSPMRCAPAALLCIAVTRPRQGPSRHANTPAPRPLGPASPLIMTSCCEVTRSGIQYTRSLRSTRARHASAQRAPARAQSAGSCKNRPGRRRPGRPGNLKPAPLQITITTRAGS